MARRNPLGSNVVATGKTLKNVKTLGSLVTFTFPDESKNGPRVVREWAKAGLDVTLLPDQRHGFHIFQSACRSVETRRSNGHDVEIKVDEVLNDGDECVYQITRMVRDKANRLIEHPKAMTIAFEKSTDTITVKELEDYDALRGLEEGIREHYKKNAKNIPGQKFRNAVRDQLLRVGAQNLRRKAGGLYFVPAEYRMKANGSEKKLPTGPVLDGLAQVLDSLYGERADFYTIPLVNDESAQEMVRKHFTINVCEQAREAMEKALQRVRKGKGDRPVRSDLVANLWNERRKIAGAVEQFDSLVNLERGEIDKNLADLDDALAQLGELADGE